jgi:hypothetical protein
MIRFIPVEDLNEPLTITLGLSGASGTGKTYTALLVARGMAQETNGPGARIGVVDTENRRALHYRDAFPEMVHFDMAACDETGALVGFNPERWIEVIDAAEAADLPVLVIDSFSHEWEGVGGVLDLHEKTLDEMTRGLDPSRRDSRSQLAWANVKPRHRRLVDRIVRAKLNIIICTRAKPVMQDAKTKLNARPTKTRMANVPWDPASDDNLMFEMTAMIMLSPDAPGCPRYLVKCADQFKSLFDPRKPMGVEAGRAMARWARDQGNAQEQKRVMDLARQQARLGRDAFAAWWQGDGRPHRNTVAPIIDELRRLAAEPIDAPSDDPFPTESEMQSAMAEAEAAAKNAGVTQ